MGEFDEVEVRNDATGEWNGGFELDDAVSDGDDTQFRIRRRSDGVQLPGWFSAMEIRPPQSPRDVVPGDGRVVELRPAGSCHPSLGAGAIVTRRRRRDAALAPLALLGPGSADDPPPGRNEPPAD